MENFLRYPDLADNPMYGCRNVTLTYDQMSARHPPQLVLGIFCIVYGICVQTAYALSLSVICRKELRRMSCYKIMLTLGMLDSTTVFICCHLTGYFYIVGVEFCMAPMLHFISGIIVIFNFCTVCSLCVLLVFNRFMDLWKRNVAEVIFKGHRTWIAIGICITYGFTMCFLAPPCLFNSDFGAWIFHPMIDGKKDMEYKSVYQTTNNLSTAILLCTFYTLIYYRHSKDMRKIGVEKDTIQRHILIQSVLVCMFTVTTTTIWSSFLFITPSMMFMHLGHTSWILMHGTPAFVYLFVNKTIKRRVLSYFITSNSISSYRQSSQKVSVPATTGKHSVGTSDVKIHEDAVI